MSDAKMGGKGPGGLRKWTQGKVKWAQKAKKNG